MNVGYSFSVDFSSTLNCGHIAFLGIFPWSLDSSQLNVFLRISVEFKVGFFHHEQGSDSPCEPWHFYSCLQVRRMSCCALNISEFFPDASFKSPPPKLASEPPQHSPTQTGDCSLVFYLKFLLPHHIKNRQHVSSLRPEVHRVF